MRGAQLLLVLALILLGAHSLLAPDAHGGRATVSQAELDRLRTIAKQAPAAEREQRWFELARYALSFSGDASGDETSDSKSITAALKESTGKLGPASLAALGAIRRHPLVSEAFVRVLVRGSARDKAEAVAEARAALDTFGPKRSRVALDLVKEIDLPPFEAGGAHRSVYRVEVLGAYRDSADFDFAFLRGVDAGIRTSAGAWAGRFVVVPAGIARETVIPSYVFPHGTGALAGVFIHTGDFAQSVALATAARATGAVLLDARPPGAQVLATNSESGGQEEDLRAQVLRGSEPAHFDGVLGYRRIQYIRAPAEPLVPLNAPFTLRPTVVERARRLAEALIAVPSISHVAIAIPTHGGDFQFAAAFAEAMRHAGKDVRVLPYEPGRRSYTSEADSFAASGAQAILFAGPGEESGEWLTALAKKAKRPLVLGTSELDPTGFHPPTRALLEGAIISGDDWSDRNPALIDRMNRVLDGPDNPAVRSGFRAGWAIGRAVVEGAYTPTRLRTELYERSADRFPIEGGYMLTAIEKRPASTKPEEIVVPLFTVKNGVAVPLTGF